MVELPGDAHEIGHVEMAEPEHVDAVDRGDVVDRLGAARGFDLGDHQGAAIGGGDLVDRRPGSVIVMRHAEAGASDAMRRVAGERDDVLGLGDGFHHRHHDAHGAGIEAAGDKVVLRRRHAHHRHDIQPAAGRHLRLDRVDAGAAVLHVVEHELRAGGGGDLRHAGREELEHHGAEG